MKVHRSVRVHIKAAVPVETVDLIVIVLIDESVPGHGVRVEEGQTVNKGELIGYVAEPSKYYVVEGPNVYFQMLKDGKPVNPLEYMGA